MAIEALVNALAQICLRGKDNESPPWYGERTLVLLREDRGLAYVRGLLEKKLGGEKQVNRQCVILDGVGAFKVSEASTYTATGRAKIKEWNSRITDAGAPHLLICGARMFGTGYNFNGVRHEIVDMPGDWLEYTQDAGRTLRLCQHAHLQRPDRTVTFHIPCLLVYGDGAKGRTYRCVKVDVQEFSATCKPKPPGDNRRELKYQSTTFQKFTELYASRRTYMRYMCELQQYAVDAKPSASCGVSQEKKPNDWLQSGIDDAVGLKPAKRGDPCAVLTRKGTCEAPCSEHPSALIKLMQKELRDNIMNNEEQTRYRTQTKAACRGDPAARGRDGSRLSERCETYCQRESDREAAQAKKANKLQKKKDQEAEKLKRRKEREAKAAEKLERKKEREETQKAKQDSKAAKARLREEKRAEKQLPRAKAVIPTSMTALEALSALPRGEIVKDLGKRVPKARKKKPQDTTDKATAKTPDRKSSG